MKGTSMHSIAWPNIFNSNYQTVNLLSGKEAVGKTLELLLNVEKGESFGDPYFGGRLKQLLFEQDSVILSDLLINELLSIIEEYVPQVKVNRNDISIRKDNTNLYAIIQVTYQIDNTTDLYTIQLTNNIQEG